ncbi:MAG: hypothetical protein M3Y87_10245 [Myxococcota bacterium]|nr:hypothetical protein [Myxococcota bacterium]
MPPGNEKIVWQSKGGGVAGSNQFLIIGLVLLGLWSCGGLTTPIFLLLGASDGLSAEMLVGAAVGLVWPALFFAIVVPLFVLPRLRPSFFLTPTTLHARRAFGGWQSVRLEELTSAERRIVVYQSRYGPREVVTSRVAMQLAGRRTADVGPIADVDGLIELLNDAVITSHVSLDALPGIVRGEPAPAEVRTDVFLAARSESGGMAYGPLFIGPTRVLRFTKVLEPSALARLYTVVGDAIDAEEAELRAVDFAKRPMAGHVLDVERAQVKLQVDRDVLFAKLPQREEEVKLAMRDADRLRTVLRRAR